MQTLIQETRVRPEFCTSNKLPQVAVAAFSGPHACKAVLSPCHFGSSQHCDITVQSDLPLFLCLMKSFSSMKHHLAERSLSLGHFLQTLISLTTHHHSFPNVCFLPSPWRCVNTFTALHWALRLVARLWVSLLEQSPSRPSIVSFSRHMAGAQ